MNISKTIGRMLCNRFHLDHEIALDESRFIVHFSTPELLQYNCSHFCKEGAGVAKEKELALKRMCMIQLGIRRNASYYGKAPLHLRPEPGGRELRLDRPEDLYGLGEETAHCTTDACRYEICMRR